jgi:hypothetical protein
VKAMEQKQAEKKMEFPKEMWDYVKLIQQVGVSGASQSSFARINLGRIVIFGDSEYILYNIYYLLIYIYIIIYYRAINI